MFEARNLTKRYGRLTALTDVSFSVRSGEVLGLIGPNGSGKTTLFECLGGVLPLDGGAVVRDGRPLTDRERAATVFYLPDAIAPWPAQSVRWAIDYTLGLFDGRADLRDEVIRRLDQGRVARLRSLRALERRAGARRGNDPGAGGAGGVAARSAGGGRRSRRGVSCPHVDRPSCGW